MTHIHPSTFHQRRPPDVEEALSSMLWTPYERATTDSSSEDNDDEWQSKALPRSQNNFDYYNFPTNLQVPLSCSYFGADNTLDTASSTEAPAVRTSSTKAVTVSQTSMTPLVPFTNLFYNHCNNNNNNHSSDNESSPSTIATVATVATVAIDSPAAANNYRFHRYKDNGNSIHTSNYRFSYPYSGELPCLRKWWSASGGVTSAIMASKNPPSYESLYTVSATRSVSTRPKEQKTIATSSEDRISDGKRLSTRDNFETNFNNNSESEISSSVVARSAMSQNQQEDFNQTSVHRNGNFGAQSSENDSDCYEECFELHAQNQENNQNLSEMQENDQQKTIFNTKLDHGFIEGFKQESRCDIWRWSSPSYRCDEAEALSVHVQQREGEAVSEVPAPSVEKCNSAVTTDLLIPNKCLAELERLYAEFRASESIIERQLTASCNRVVEKTGTGCETGGKMRLSIPVSSETKQTENKLIATQKSAFVSSTPTSTCTVVLTSSPTLSTNLSNLSNRNNNNYGTVAILTTSDTAYQDRQSGLTIEVNKSSKNLEVQNLQLNQQVVKNNGVSVVNCNYVKPINNGNNNSYDQDNNNFVANSVISSNIRVNENSISSVPKSFNVNNHLNNNNNNNHNDNKNKVISHNYSNKNSNSFGVVENVVKNYHPNYSSTITTPSVDSVHIIKVNNVSTLNQTSVAPLSTPSTPNHSTTLTTSSVATPTTPSSPTIAATYRTFTSTECQTDDVSPASANSTSREQGERPLSSPRHTQTATSSRDLRRRERRERRQQQHQHQHQHQNQHLQIQQLQQSSSPNLMPSIPARCHAERHSLHGAALPSAVTHLHPPHLHHPLPSNATMPAAMSALLRPMLPDLLHSHFPPPYSALPLANANGQMTVSLIPPPAPSLLSHTPTIRAASSPGPPPAGTTILTPVISTVPIPGATSIVSDGRFTLPLPMIRRSPSERSGKGCCGQWFAGPPLRALIAVVALGGVACALSGAALGATGLAGPPSSHLTAALLMIGVGVVLVTVSGAAWRMTAPGGPSCLGLGSSVDLGRCGRRPCSRGGGASHGLLYPEFQHRPPPPSYQASMQEYRLRLLLLDRDRQSGVVRGSSPPPTYRSHVRSLLRAPLTTTSRIGGGSSIGDSEYSFPPSYRSRNNTATPATICSERSIETAPSGRLLANEDIPEPLSVEQLPEYNISQYSNRRSIVTGTTSRGLLETSNIITRALTTSGTDISNNERNQSNVITNTGNEPTNHGSLSKENDNSSSISSLSKSGKELVTIVTISEANAESTGKSYENAVCSASDHIEILAHL